MDQELEAALRAHQRARQGRLVEEQVAVRGEENPWADPTGLLMLTSSPAPMQFHSTFSGSARVNLRCHFDVSGV